MLSDGYCMAYCMVYNMLYMIEFLQNNWGDLASALGLAATALAAALAALNARSAKQAAIEARDGIGRTLTGVEVQKAIDLIERVKERHAQNRWEAAADRYPDLRVCLIMDAGSAGVPPATPEARIYGVHKSLKQLFSDLSNTLSESCSTI